MPPLVFRLALMHTHVFFPASALVNTMCVSSWLSLNLSPQQCVAYCIGYAFATSASSGGCQCSTTMTGCTIATGYTTYVVSSATRKFVMVKVTLTRQTLWFCLNCRACVCCDLAYSLVAPNTVCTMVGSLASSGYWLGVRTSTPQQCTAICAAVSLPYAFSAPDGDCNCGTGYSACSSGESGYSVYQN